MNRIKIVALGLFVLTVGHASAFFWLFPCRKTPDTTFIHAVKHGDVKTFERLYSFIEDQRTFDKALRAAARNGDAAMFHMIAPRASANARHRASDSLIRHHKRKCPCCSLREITYV
jgi:hypothetical protein